MLFGVSVEKLNRLVVFLPSAFVATAVNLYVLP